MQIRFQHSPLETSKMNTAELRSNFLIQQLMLAGEINLVHPDRAAQIRDRARPEEGRLQ